MLTFTVGFLLLSQSEKRSLMMSTTHTVPVMGRSVAQSHPWLSSHAFFRLNARLTFTVVFSLFSLSEEKPIGRIGFRPMVDICRFVVTGRRGSGLLSSKVLTELCPLNPSAMLSSPLSPPHPYLQRCRDNNGGSSRGDQGPLL